jgi:hypothetical protein
MLNFMNRSCATCKTGILTFVTYQTYSRSNETHVANQKAAFNTDMG